MESQNAQPQPRDTNSKLKAMWWLVAAALVIATVLAALARPIDWMAIVGRSALIVAAVLLATAKPEETRSKKVLIYTLCAVSLGLLLARFINR